MTDSKYFIIETSVLPEIFIKVAKANKLLQTGKIKTVNEAVSSVGISRSAFYKYKDSIKPFYEMTSDRIITFHIIVSDEPGILSSILNLFAKSGANILTINQNIPINGQATIIISARTGGMKVSLNALSRKVSEQTGVSRFEILATE